MKAKELMIKTVHSVNVDQNLQDAAQLMWEKDCGWAPVIDENGKVQATITDRDIAMAAYLNNARLADIPLHKAQSKSLVTCSQSDDISAIEKIMQSHQLRRLPVVDRNGKLVGLIALNDIAIAYRSGKNGIDAKGLSDTLAAICSHQHVSPPVAAAG